MLFPADTKDIDHMIYGRNKSINNTKLFIYKLVMDLHLVSD